MMGFYICRDAIKLPGNKTTNATAFFAWDAGIDVPQMTEGRWHRADPTADNPPQIGMAIGPLIGFGTAALSRLCGSLEDGDIFFVPLGKVAKIGKYRGTHRLKVGTKKKAAKP